MLCPRKTVEIGIAVSRSLGSINLVKMLKREIELGSKRLRLVLDFALLERRKLVEERKDEDGIDGDHESLQEEGEQADIHKELVSGRLDDLQNTGENGASHNSSENLSFDKVANEL